MFTSAATKREEAELKKFAMPEKIRPIEQMLELSPEEPLSSEHLDSQVKKAQDQLLHLKRQQEQIEKQKRELEELSRKQEELERGRVDMTDKLTRSLVVLEREAYDAQKRLEQLRAMRESFGQHLELIRSEEHTSELQSRPHLVCRLLLEKTTNIQHKNERTPRSNLYILSSPAPQV